MSHRSPKPIGATAALNATALRRVTDQVDWLEQNQQALADLLAGELNRKPERWLARIQADPEAWVEVTPGWTYTVEAVTVALTLDGDGLLDAETTTTNTGDDSMSGLAYNLRELLNTNSDADGTDVSALPGTFAMLPVSGIVECWHQALEDGTVVIMFDVRNPIDGACE